jgi:predicted DNA-binding antitoxin AbrB/MazE fold protein
VDTVYGDRGHRGKQEYSLTFDTDNSSGVGTVIQAADFLVAMLVLQGTFLFIQCAKRRRLSEMRVDAIYEDGVLRPVTPLGLGEHERVTITVEPFDETTSILSTSRSAGLNWKSWGGSLLWPRPRRNCGRFGIFRGGDSSRSRGPVRPSLLD